MPRFGRGSIKRSKAQEERQQQQQQQHFSDDEQEQDDKATEDSIGYAVKGGSSGQHRRMSINHKLKSTEDSPDSFERRHHTLSFSKTASLRRMKKNAPPRMSLYARRFDEINPSRGNKRLSTYNPSIQIGTNSCVTKTVIHVFILPVSNDLNVNISSCTECTNCHRLVYDEDIMSNWSASDAVYNTQYVTSFCSVVFIICCIVASCPYCGQPFVAQLVVHLQQVCVYYVLLKLHTCVCMCVHTAGNLDTSTTNSLIHY